MKTTSFFAILLFGANTFANTGLEDAFQQALKASDNDKSSSLATITLEENSRMAGWNKKVKQKIILPTSMAVDMPYSVTKSYQPAHAPHIETDHDVASELNDIK